MSKKQGMVAIYCKNCQGMIFACEDKPIVIADSATIIKKYNRSGHHIKKVSRYEVKNNFKGCIPGCDMFFTKAEKKKAKEKKKNHKW